MSRIHSSTPGVGVYRWETREPVIQIDTRRRIHRRPKWTAEIWFTIISVAVMCLIGGYFAGREHLKYEGRKMMQDIAADWAKAMEAYESHAEKEMQEVWREYAKTLEALNE